MRKTIYFFLFLFISIMAYSQIPQSKRSKEVIKRQYPILDKSFQKKGFIFGNPVFIRIIKDDYELEVWIKKEKTYDLYKSYKICTYSGGLGPKKKEGDGKSPEGFYYAYPKSLNPSSNFHLSFNTNYPNEYDRANKYTGSALMIHGSCVSIGCYAMEDEGIEEIYSILQKAFENGQSKVDIHIFPFKMTESNMLKYINSESYGFWENIKEGYDYFEKTKIPARVSVKNKKYVISK